RNDHFAENFTDCPGQRLVGRTVTNNDPAEGRLFVSSKCLVPCFAKIDIGTDAARICMLKYCDRWLFEFADQVRCRANIKDVIKRKLFAVKFFKIFVKSAVERGALMRIFSITKTINQRQ